MSRRPWIGVGLSMAVHVVLFALLVVAVTRDDGLPPLVVDLREGFRPEPTVAPPRSGGAASDAPAPAAERRRWRVLKRATSPAAAPAPEAPAPPAPAPPPPAIAVSPPAEAPPSPTLDVPRAAPAAVPPSPRESPPSRSLAGASAGDRPLASGGQGSGGSESSTAGGGGAASVASDRPGPGGGGRAGQALALAVPGGGSGVGAEYGPYLTALRQRIAQSVRYPASARRRGISGTVNVEILILPNGVVGEVQLLESSTHQVLDEAALKTIRSLPRMPLPADLPARPLRVRVPVVFQIN
jgi:protein TonB